MDMSMMGLTPEEMLEAGAKATLGGKNLEASLSPYIFGLAIDLVLLGVMAHQVVFWGSYMPMERWWVRVVIAWVVLVTTAVSVFNMYIVWDTFVLGFGTFTRFVDFKRLTWYAVLDAIIAVPIHCFYLERAWRLTQRNTWVLVFLAPIILISLVGGVGAMVAAGQIDSFMDVQTIRPWFYLWVSSTFVADILLAGLMTYGLSRSRTGWSKTDRMVNRLLKIAIETQIPPTCVSCALMITYTAAPASLLNIFWEMYRSKVYVVSLLALLNHRFSLWAKNADDEDSIGKRSNAYGSSRIQQQTIRDLDLDQIHVETTVYQETYRVSMAKPSLNRAHPDDTALKTALKGTNGDIDTDLDMGMDVKMERGDSKASSSTALEDFGSEVDLVKDKDKGATVRWELDGK